MSDEYTGALQFAPIIFVLDHFVNGIELDYVNKIFANSIRFACGYWNRVKHKASW